MLIAVLSDLHIDTDDETPLFGLLEVPTRGALRWQTIEF